MEICLPERSHVTEWHVVMFRKKKSNFDTNSDVKAGVAA